MMEIIFAEKSSRVRLKIEVDGNKILHSEWESVELVALTSI